MEVDGLTSSIKKIDHIVVQAVKEVNDLKELLIGKKVAAKLQEHIATFEARYNSYIGLLESNSDYDQFTKLASMLATYLTAIAQGLQKNVSLDEKLKALSNRLLDYSRELTESIEDREVTFSIPSNEKVAPLIRTVLPESKDSEALKNRLAILKSQLEESEERHDKRQISLSKRLDTIESSLDSIEGDIQSRLESVDSLYSTAKIELEEKQKSVDDLLGIISSTVIAGDYDSSAVSEKKVADWLRIGSIICMVLIAIVVGFSLYETTTDTFKWENSLFRLVFTILLSVPAAYLARESTKHREQQYSHLQTSLDLKAITPYLASLPIEEQHRLKSEIANRLFASKSYSLSANESYPINTHELLMKLLDKVDFKAKGDSSTNKTA